MTRIPLTKKRLDECETYPVLTEEEKNQILDDYDKGKIYDELVYELADYFKNNKKSIVDVVNELKEKSTCVDALGEDWRDILGYVKESKIQKDKFIAEISLLKAEYKIVKQKLESKLKIMEISFEQINNSRNDMIRQLAECETALETK